MSDNVGAGPPSGGLPTGMETQTPILHSPVDETDPTFRNFGSSIRNDPGSFFRFLSLNINGFDSQSLGQDVTNILRTCCLSNAHFIGFSEPNIDFTTPKAKYVVTSTTTNSEPAIKCCLASSSTKTGSFYKPGGIASFARDRGYHRCGDFRPDPFGRFTVALLSGNGTRSIAVFTVYQCCKGAEGPRSFFHQQTRLNRAGRPTG